MSVFDCVTLASCAGSLGLAILVMIRGGRSPLARSLAMVFIDQFAFDGADIAGHLSTAPEWPWIDNTASSLLPALLLQFIVRFVGRSHELRWIVRAGYLVFGPLSALCALSFVSARAAAFEGSPPWAMAMMAGFVPLLMTVIGLLVSHLRHSSSPIERSRTVLVVGAVLIASAGGVTDLLADSGVGVPHFAAMGTLVASVLMAGVVLRFRLFEIGVRALNAANALVLAILMMAGYLAVFRFLGTSQALLILGTATVTLALVPASIGLMRSRAVRGERLAYHARLGRFSAQMAHDLKNPMAAVKGAAQLLLRAQERGQPVAEAQEYLQLIVDQVDRVGLVIGEYQRLGRVDPILEPLALNELVRSVLALQPLAAPTGVTLKAELAEGLAPCLADLALVARALENLIRNAFEATPGGGTVTVSTRRQSPGFLVLSVQDTGVGMDARLREQVFEDFFTTKTQGSGLGLSFVKRVAEAHGGEVQLESEEGRGTVIRLLLRSADSRPT